jgi:hypothetical protein
MSDVQDGADSPVGKGCAQDNADIVTSNVPYCGELFDLGAVGDADG